MKAKKKVIDVKEASSYGVDLTPSYTVRGWLCVYNLEGGCGARRFFLVGWPAPFSKGGAMAPRVFAFF